jgi:hypothetical protein
MQFSRHFYRRIKDAAIHHGAEISPEATDSACDSSRKIWVLLAFALGALPTRSHAGQSCPNSQKLTAPDPKLGECARLARASPFPADYERQQARFACFTLATAGKFKRCALTFTLALTRANAYYCSIRA